MFDNRIALFAFFLSVAVSSVFGELFTDQAQLPQNKSYDFIIVGGMWQTPPQTVPTHIYYIFQSSWGGR